MTSGRRCYWFNQGKCFLFHMEEEMVYSILSQVPQAREDLIRCGYSCPEVDSEHITYAKDEATLVEEEFVGNEAHRRRMNRYIDYHRYAESNSTMPKPGKTND